MSAIAADSARRVDVLGCKVDPLTMDETLERCEQLIDERGYAQHMAINAAKLVAMQDDERLRSIVDSCALVNADGQSVVWGSRLLGTPLPERVAGIDLMSRLLARAELRGWRVFILGARADVLDAAVATLRERHPALQIVGTNDGYFDESEVAGVCAAIRQAHADILFVAMSTPQKEYFLGEHGAELNVPLVMGVGGAIDVVAGVTRRAPEIWQRLGLEWLYRLLQEPRRMVGRYARTNTRFMLLLSRQLARRRSA